MRWPGSGRWPSGRADGEGNACYSGQVNVEPRHPLLPPSGMTEEEWDVLRDARAEADVAAGRLIPHEEVMEWVAKWGASEETPIPPEWLA